jgi:NAD(P)-dependent dehydrogenase (short-subunit alcohol dehydrogenase family)
MCIFICVLLIYFISLINTVVNFIGFTLIVLIISWKVNNAIKGYFIGKRVISSNGKAVLITGCDSGFGNALALKLNELGFYVIATCLNVECTGAQHLTNKSVFPHRISVIKLDVTQDLEVIQTYDEISQILLTNNLELWSLVNNAGIFGIGFVEWGNGIEAYKKTIDVNVFGCLRVTRLFLPLIRESRGRVINMSSIASRMSPEGYSSYVMSKHALQAFTDTLRKEMFRFGVRVIGIEPSCYRYLKIFLMK